MEANPLSWDYLTQSPPVSAPLGPLAIAFYALCAVGLAVSIFFAAWGKDRLSKGNNLLRRLLRTYATIGYSVFGMALIFMVLRVLGIPFLSMRLWTYLSALMILGAGLYILYFQLARYPSLAAQVRQAQESKRYLRSASRSAGKGKKRRRR